MPNKSNDTTPDAQLSLQQQRAVLGLGATLAAAIVVGAYVFYRLAPADSNAADAILWACTGGFMGGAGTLAIHVYLGDWRPRVGRTSRVSQ